MRHDVAWHGNFRVHVADVQPHASEGSGQLMTHNLLLRILVGAVLEEGLQVDVWAGYVRDTIEGFQTKVPGGLQLELVFDQSGYTADRLMEVGTNMAIGVTLVIGVLLITLGIRAALIVAIILQIFYTYIVSKIDGIVNRMEDASIALVDVMAKNKVFK